MTSSTIIILLLTMLCLYLMYKLITVNDNPHKLDDDTVARYSSGNYGYGYNSIDGYTDIVGNLSYECQRVSPDLTKYNILISKTLENSVILMLYPNQHMTDGDFKKEVSSRGFESYTFTNQKVLERYGSQIKMPTVERKHPEKYVANYFHNMSSHIESYTKEDAYVENVPDHYKLATLIEQEVNKLENLVPPELEKYYLTE